MNYKELIAYKKSYTLSLSLYEKTETFPKSELYGIVSQLRRASLSVPLNIAEGYRRGQKDYVRFLKISLGSCAEVETLLEFSKDLKYLNTSDFNYFYKLNEEIGKLVATYIKKLS